MQIIISYLFKAVSKLVRHILYWMHSIYCHILFYSQNVQYKNFKTNGLPFVSVARGARCFIDEGFVMNNTIKENPIGRTQPCILFVDYGASLIIGKNVGISGTALVAHLSITIGNNAKIGGGVCIYDTDFHSLKAKNRLTKNNDYNNENKKAVFIDENAFIGAHSTILKGVSIGKNSVIGACSVVTKNVPDNEIWAGNPAKFIKNI